VKPDGLEFGKAMRSEHRLEAEPKAPCQGVLSAQPQGKVCTPRRAPVKDCVMAASEHVKDAAGPR
jgi:hypothetical protein